MKVRDEKANLSPQITTELAQAKKASRKRARWAFQARCGAALLALRARKHQPLRQCMYHPIKVIAVSSKAMLHHRPPPALRCTRLQAVKTTARPRRDTAATESAQHRSLYAIGASARLAIIVCDRGRDTLAAVPQQHACAYV